MHQMNGIILSTLTNQVRGRFQTRFVKDEKSGCWPWAGYLKNGYGEFKIRGITYPANRIAWCMANHSTPGQLLILHTCDNSKCVNPEHLYIGDNADNMRDRKVRRRWTPPSRDTHPGTKIRSEYVADVAYLWKTGRYTQEDIAAFLGVTRGCIQRILMPGVS